jgi:hypothetical protein
VRAWEGEALAEPCPCAPREPRLSRSFALPSAHGLIPIRITTDSNVSNPLRPLRTSAAAPPARKRRGACSSIASDAPKQPQRETSPHDAPWRFRKRNKFGRGNPLSGRVEKFRARLLTRLTVEDFDSITAKLIKMAKAGELAAIREIFDRLFGKPKQEVTKHVDEAIRTVIDGDDRAAALLDRVRARFMPGSN